MTFLGIDGGGSKTTFLLEDKSGIELARLTTGPSNWVSIGPDRSRRALAEGIRALPQAPDVVCGGFAGAGRPEGAAFYKDTIQSLLPQAQVLVETDAFVSYVGSLGLRPGVLLIAGTGSIALARRNDGTMVRAGGWGPIFSDEGSGFWIGRAAISDALRASEAGACPGLVDLVVRTIGLQTIVEVPAAWTGGALDVPKVAALAHALLESPAEVRGEPGERILREAATHLRNLTQFALNQAGLPASSLKAASGSIATSPEMQRLIGLDFSAPSYPPERGAILWARDKILPA